jgi:hypothetical protein
VAHYLAGGQGQVGLQGEKIDDYSYTRRRTGSNAGRPAGTSMYRQQLDRCRDALAIGLGKRPRRRRSTRTSAGLSDLHLDQNPDRAREEEDS